MRSQQAHKTTFTCKTFKNGHLNPSHTGCLDFLSYVCVQSEWMKYKLYLLLGIKVNCRQPQLCPLQGKGHLQFVTRVLTNDEHIHSPHRK